MLYLSGYINAVMIRSIWLPEPEKLPFTGADIETKKRLPSRVELAAMVTLAEAHDAAGYAQSFMSLALWIALAEDLGERELANRLRTLDRY